LSPWRLLCAYNRTCRGSHPFQKISNLSGEATIDFWGPCLVVSSYGAVLWLARVNNVQIWVYAIWALTATFNHLVCRVWYARSSVLFHCALLGYSLTPAVPLAVLVCLVRSSVWLAYLLQYVTVLFATIPAVLAYHLICSGPSQSVSHLPGSSGTNALGGVLSSPLPSPTGNTQVQAVLLPVQEKKAAVGLLIPPTVLMLLYLVSLLPN